MIEYGTKKLQMGSNLEPHKQKKNKLKQKCAIKQYKNFIIVTMYNFTTIAKRLVKYAMNIQ